MSYGRDRQSGSCAVLAQDCLPLLNAANIQFALTGSSMSLNSAIRLSMTSSLS